MEDGTSVNHTIHDDGTEEFTNWRSSTMAFHKGIFYLITGLGVCLQLEFTAASPSFVSAFRTTLLMRLFIVVLPAYCGSYGVMLLHTRRGKTDFGEFMNGVSVLLGTLASVVELLILFPPFGYVALFFWSICLVTLAINSFRFSVTLCKSVVAKPGRVYWKLKYLITKHEAANDHTKTLPV